MEEFPIIDLLNLHLVLSDASTVPHVRVTYRGERRIIRTLGSTYSN